MTAPPTTGLHDDALAVLSEWRTADPGQERLRTAYVAHLTAHPDGLLRDDVPDHLTAGALVLSADRSRCLLTLHAKARRWFHLGGHCEPEDSTLAGAALREALEESGIAGLELDPEPLHLDTHEVAFCGTRARVRHLDVRYLAVAPAGSWPTISEESIEVRWWPVDDLPTDEPGLHRLVELALARSQTSSAAISAAPSGEQSGGSAWMPS